MNFEDLYISWNAKDWLWKCQMSVAEIQFDELRKKVFENNIKIVEDERYMSADGTKVELNNLWNVDPLASNVFYENEVSIINPEYKYFTAVNVVKEDYLVQAKKMLDKDCNADLCLINMANQLCPGGGVERGSEGLEEDLFRRSDYFRFLFQYADSQNYEYDKLYGIPHNPHHQYPLEYHSGGVFSRGVTIFRDTEAHGYALLAEPWQVNFVAIPNISARHRIRRFRNYEPIKERIRNVLRIAYNNGQRRLVFCIFHEYSDFVAQSFKHVFDEMEFGSIFREICFASIKENNFKTFSEALLFP